MSTLDQRKDVMDGVVGTMYNDAQDGPYIVPQNTVFIPEWGPPKPVQEYVCGFLFNTAGTYVVLIKRRMSRAYRPGCWNGVGGKIEPGETPLQAMQREFKEEAGLEVGDWKKFGTLMTDGGESLLHLFMAEVEVDTLYKVSTETDETVRPIALTSLPGLPRMPNLSWLLAMAQSFRHCGVKMYNVVEEGKRGF